MHEAELPKKRFWTVKKIGAGAAVFLLASGGAYGIAYGFDPAIRAWNSAQSVAVKTFRDVFSTGRNGAAVEFDLGSGTGSSGSAEIASAAVSANLEGSASVKSPKTENMNAQYITAAQGSGGASDVPAASATSSTRTAQSVSTTASSSAFFSAPPVAKVYLPASTPSLAASSTAFAAPAPSCDFNATDTPTHKVLLNEIAWMGSLQDTSGETATEASGREWMELRNNNGEDVDLSDWQIVNQTEKFKIMFGGSAKIDFGEFFLLERDGNFIPGVPADNIYSGGLSNAGEWLRLFDGNCRLIDEINASSGWPGGSNSTKATLERDNTDLGWHTSGFAGGTPKAQNSVVWNPASVAAPAIVSPAPEPATQAASSGTAPITASATSTSSSTALVTASDTEETSAASSSTPAVSGGLSHPVIAAVGIAGAESSNDFVKIFNLTDIAVDISGWKLHKRTNTGTEDSLRTFPLGSIVASGGYFAWANSMDGFAASVSANVSSTATLAADNSVAIENTSGTVIDAVAWGTGTNQFVEGAAYPADPAANQVLSRKFVDGVLEDSDNNAEDFTLQ